MSYARPKAKPSIGIYNFGCRLNQYEADGMIQSFLESGRYTYLPIQCGPDLAIINTCTVTAQADARNRNLIRRIRKKNPAAMVIVTGCYAQTDAKKAGLAGASLVIGNEYKSSLLEIVEKKIAGKKAGENITALSQTFAPGKEAQQEKHKELERLKTVLEREKKDESSSSYPKLDRPFAYGKVLPFERSRAYLKIQDGCSKTCSYCKIPLARGKGISRPYEEVLEHAQYLDEREVPEIVLTGVNLGWYKDRKAGLAFIGLLEKILERLNHARLRLSSIEPCDVDEALAKLSLHPRFCDFLHVPLQSGSAPILRAMRRSYTPYSYQKRIEKIRKYNPDIFLGTDLMIAFPGESKEDFAESLRFCRSMSFAAIHAFPYSARPGTRAAKLSQKLDRPTVRQRMASVQQLRSELWHAYAKKQEGSLKIGIVEKIDKDNAQAEALTDNYLRVGFSAQVDPKTRKPGSAEPLIAHSSFVRLRVEARGGDFRMRGSLERQGLI